MSANYPNTGFGPPLPPGQGPFGYTARADAPVKKGEAIVNTNMALMKDSDGFERLAGILADAVFDGFSSGPADATNAINDGDF